MGENSTCKTVTGVSVVLLLLIGGVVIAYFATDHFGMDSDDGPPLTYLTPAECYLLNGTVYGDSCYTNSELLLSWTDAQSVCNVRGGSLASILNAGENDVIANLAFNRSSHTQAWFGLNDQAQQGSFVFIRDGAALGAFNSWVADGTTGAPTTDPDASFQSCANMLKSPFGKWRMSLCSELHLFVCQYRIASLPSASSAPTAVAGVGSATIQFGAPASDGGNAIFLYTVVSSPGGVTANGTGSPIVVSGLLVGQSYTFHVFATNMVGDGPLSPASNAVTPFASVPNAPLIGTAIAGSESASISFTPPTFDGFAAITSFHLKTYDSVTGAIIPGPAGTTSSPNSPLVITTLTNGQSYRFSVYAVNSVGSSVDSAQSNSVSPAAGAPTVVRNVLATALNRGASIAFTPPFSDGGSAITLYTVNVLPGNTSVTGTTSPIVVSDLTVGESYTFTVVATSAQGNSLASAQSNAVVPYAVVPSSPSASNAVAGGGRARITFSPPTDDGGASIMFYHVNTTDVNSGESSLFAFPASAFSALTPPFIADVRPLIPTASYTFTVLAVNSIGSSLPSAVVGPVTIIVDIPDAPFNVMAVGGKRAVFVTWNEPFNGGNTISSYAVVAHPGPVVLTGVTSLNATLTNLTPGTAYNFTVVATNAQGDSLLSMPSNNVVPTADAPGKPTLDNVNPGALQATLAFTPPLDDGGSPITSYYAITVPDRSVQNPLPPAGWNQGGPTSPLTVTHLLPQSYEFRIVARNLFGDSEPSDLPIISSIGVGIPDPPTEIFASSDGGRNVKVYFQEPEFDGGSDIRNYTVFANPGDNQATGVTSPILITDLADGTYRFLVIATNANGNSLPSLSSNAITISSSEVQLLPLWIILGILGFVAICVALFFIRKCLLVQKNRNHSKISKQTASNDNELVIIKQVDDEGGTTSKSGGTSGDEEETLSSSGTATATDVEGGSSTKATKTTATDDDESHWVSHN